MNTSRRAHKLRSFAMCVSMLAYLYMLLIGSNQFVLCFGADGHMAVESTRNGLGCATSLSCPPLTLHPEQESALHADHCGPCVDVLLSSLFQHFIPSQYNGAGHADLAFQTVSYLSSPYSHMANGNFLTRLSPTVREILMFLRTVILLT